MAAMPHKSLRPLGICVGVIALLALASYFYLMRERVICRVVVQRKHAMSDILEVRLKPKSIFEFVFPTFDFNAYVNYRMQTGSDKYGYWTVLSGDLADGAFDDPEIEVADQSEQQITLIDRNHGWRWHFYWLGNEKWPSWWLETDSGE